jgi:hypothetical protein
MSFMMFGMDHPTSLSSFFFLPTFEAILDGNWLAVICFNFSTYVDGLHLNFSRQNIFSMIV